MAFFRKKPITVEAKQLTDRNIGEVRQWCDGGTWIENEVIQGISIKTLEGVMFCGFGNWVIKGMAGEFYPCRDDIFRNTYEELKTTTNEN